MAQTSIDSGVTWLFVLMILYWSYCIFWGIRGALAVHCASGYFIAGRGLTAWVFILAATATSFSGWTFLGTPGVIYNAGFQFPLTFFAGIMVAFPGVLFLKRQWMLGKRFGYITPGEMLGAYFDSRLIRVLIVLVALVFSVPYVGIQLRASGFLFNALTDGALGQEFGMWVLSMVLLSYVATGGLRTVAHVDVLQGVLTAGGIVALGAAVLYLVGGVEPLLEGLAVLSLEDPVRTPAGHSHYVAISGVIQAVADGSQATGGMWTGSMNLTYLMGILGIMASPAFTMWAFANRSPAAFAPQQVWVSSLLMGAIVIVFTASQGLGGHLLGADTALMVHHPELVNPVLVEGLRGVDLLDTPGRQDMLVPQLIRLLGDTAPWLPGLLAVCALCALQSTAAAYMATAGGMITRDLVGAFLVPSADDRTQVFIGRLSTTAVVLAALVVATTGTDALVLLGGLAVSYGFQIWPALVAVCYWPFLTRQGVVAGLVAGLVVVTLTESIGPQWLGITAWGRWPLTIHSAAWGMAANLSVVLVVSLLTRDDRPRKGRVHAFLRRHTHLPRRKRRLIPLAWGLTLAWFLCAAGPVAVVGNTLFSDPDDPATWWLGLPSLWIWQALGWILGVALMWFLAYHMELAAGLRRSFEPEASAPPRSPPPPLDPDIRGTPGEPRRR